MAENNLKCPFTKGLIVTILINGNCLSAINSCHGNIITLAANCRNTAPGLSHLQIGQQADALIRKHMNVRFLRSINSYNPLFVPHIYEKKPNPDCKLKGTIFNPQLVATRQKSSCSLATSNGHSRGSGSTLSLLSAAVDRLGLEAWRRVEEMQLGT